LLGFVARILWPPIGNAIVDAIKSANRKQLDFIFVFVDPGESPPTHHIRAQGGEGKDVLSLTAHLLPAADHL
jgi:hypothetical protein